MVGAAVRGEFRRVIARAGVRRRFAPHHYADSRVMPTRARQACEDRGLSLILSA
jgi:hypothetical protein